jgi:periplasmic protein TonB
MKAEATAEVKWEDIVFENRNREYGAYLIRKIYSKNVLMAAGLMLALVATLLASPYIAAFFKSNDGDEKKVLKNTVVSLDQPPPIMPNQPPPPRLEIPPPVKTLKYVAPKVTAKEVVEEEIPTIEEIKKTEISTETTEGPETVVFEEPVREVVSEGEDNSIHTFVEQQPEFPGGLEAMMKFIQKNMKYPAQARRMGTEGKVFVGFVVNKDGGITDVETIKGISAECDKEAARVVSLMPHWKVGKQNGKPVRVKYVLPINFKLAQ